MKDTLGLLIFFELADEPFERKIYLLVVNIIASTNFYEGYFCRNKVKDNI